MPDFMATLAEQATYYRGLEGVAVVCAVIYLLLAIRQNIACWFFAGVSTAFYVYVFVDARLYMESALNVFYFAMAVYGWHSWRNAKAETAAQLAVTQWPVATHVTAILVIIAASAVSGYILETMTDAAFPYVDSATTWASIWATYLVTQKVLENWWYWLVIDIASILIYWSRDLELTALLFVVYVIMIPFGLISWRRSMQQVAA